MRMMVTGGAGFIGSNFVLYGLSQGYEILNVDCLSYASGQAMLEPVENHANYQFLQADIADEPTMARALQTFNPQVVVNLAAETHVDRSIASARPFVSSNVTGTYCLVNQLHQYWKQLPWGDRSTFRLVHISTDEVFGSLSSDGSFSESSPYAPRSPYAATKASADHLVRAWFHTHQLPSVIVHPSNNYGPNQHPEKLIPMVIRSCIADTPIPVYGDGQNIRDWLYVEDFCEALFQIVLRGKIGHSYNVGGQNPWNNLSLVQEICELVDRALDRKGKAASRDLIQFVDDRPGHDFRYSLDCEKIHAELGWRPRHSPEAGFTKTVQWYLANRQRLLLSR